ncbi:class I SAM-dependent methyltransferase [Spirosoma sp. BT702]|uniref:Class I SAM-dependent methyltransferase n=1 Tax=Spirosoma profusum TaxID=2771354 RepID=A0A927AU88_9BACT|nr:class I SAM-dependent methyltransferase [Spirosoma profusum]MBD2703032.1 class I SAM-dependent methyltransferase [Spirosoma profusum]
MNDFGIGVAYEAIADWFDQNRTKILFEKPYLEILLQHCQSNTSVLDLGCGTGEPIARYLIEQGCYVIGVDNSLNMIAMCRKRFPNMEWIVADMTKVSLPQKFGAVVAWDSFFHLPHDAQRAMFPIFASHTADGGILLFTSGTEQGIAYGEMNGHTVYHASLDSAEYQSLLEANGFDVVIHKINDETCGNRTVWLAQKKGTKTQP